MLTDFLVLYLFMVQEMMLVTTSYRHSNKTPNLVKGEDLCFVCYFDSKLLFHVSEPLLFANHVPFSNRIKGNECRERPVALYLSTRHYSGR